jgi:hypothetical protein
VALTWLRFRPAAEAAALWGLSALGGYPAIVIPSGGMLLLWGLGRCCSIDDEPKILVQKQPIWDQFKFTFLALAVVLCVGVVAAGWRAKVNGIPVEVLGGNFIFRAVRVQAGENTIHFYYPKVCISRSPFLAGRSSQ